MLFWYLVIILKLPSMEQSDTNFIHLDGDKSEKTGGNIFNELGGDLDFGTVQAQAETAPVKTQWYEIWNKVSYVLMVLMILFGILATADVYVKTMDDNSIISALPYCEYLATYGVDGYENKECKTISMIQSEVTANTKKLQDYIVDNLGQILPKKLDLMNVAGSSVVRFIQDHVNRVNIVDALSQFETFKNASSNIYGKYIECKPDSIDEKG